MKRTSFWVLVLKGLVGLHRTVQVQLLQHYWLGHGLGITVDGVTKCFQSASFLSDFLVSEK